MNGKLISQLSIFILTGNIRQLISVISVTGYFYDFDFLKPENSGG